MTELLAYAGPARRRGSAPLHLLPGHPRHGVTCCARQLAAATGAPMTGHLDPHRLPERAHLHVTDQILARRPGEAADIVEETARHTRLTLTVHDVPQPTDGPVFAARCGAYRRMVAAAHDWTTNSEHERALLSEHCGVSGGRSIPLPLVVPAVLPEPRIVVGGPTIGLFGHVYPGKGHWETLDAVAELPPGIVTVLVIGGPGPGHEHRITDLRAHADRRGVALVVTGYLPQDDALATMRGSTVALTAHRNISASASINAWVAAGRRPLVREGAYARELERLRPGTHLVYRDEDLPTRLLRALADPGSTWRPTDHDPGPGLADVASRYRAWWGAGR